MIQYNVIKSVGLKIPSLTFGGAGIGNLFQNLTNTEAIEIVERSIKIGWRSFDTAPHYGSSLSEIRVGLGLRSLDRDDFVLSTKVGRILEPRQESGLEAGEIFFNENPFNRVYDYSYDGIMRSYEHSLRRLGTRRIDILFVHDIGTYAHGQTQVERDYFRTLCESGFTALEELKRNGQIKAYGIGTNEQEILMEAIDHTNMDIVLLANRYNLLETDRSEFFAKCKKHNVSVAVAAPFATGVLVAANFATSMYEYGKVPEKIVKRVIEILDICQGHRVPIGAAALQFPLRNENVVTVTCGVQSVEQAQQNYDWAQWNIPNILWKDLADIEIQHHSPEF
jgi:D-threo-aldose 1-dehydrogenase